MSEITPSSLWGGYLMPWIIKTLLALVIFYVGLQAKIKELREETATMSDGAKVKTEQRLKALKKGNADIQRWLEDLKSKGTESWKDIKALVSVSGRSCKKVSTRRWSQPDSVDIDDFFSNPMIETETVFHKDD
jgi:hypothetical protein